MARWEGWERVIETMRNKDKSKGWNRKVLHKLMTYARHVYKEVQHHIHYFQGTKHPRSEGAESDNVDGKSRGYHRQSSLRTDSHSQEEKVRAPETSALTPLRHWPQP